VLIWREPDIDPSTTAAQIADTDVRILVER
jgi:hypothetical protein